MTDFEPHANALAELARRAGELKDAIETRRLAQLGENADFQSEVWDRKDQADANESVLIEDAEMDRAVAELREIEMAQARLAHGLYGQCVTCGMLIDPQRLKVQPAASRCMDCQMANERSAGSA